MWTNRQIMKEKKNLLNNKRMNRSVNLGQRLPPSARPSLTEFVNTISKVFPGAEVAVFLARLITLVNASGFAETVDIIG